MAFQNIEFNCLIDKPANYKLGVGMSEIIYDI
jgi:hypothetical protein